MHAPSADNLVDAEKGDQARKLFLVACLFFDCLRLSSIHEKANCIAVF